MYTSIELLDMAKARLGGVSDNKMAEVLGVTGSSISLIRCNKVNFSATQALKLANILDLDPLKCIGSMQYATAKKMNRKDIMELWEQYA